MIILKTRDVKYTYQQGKPVLRGISTELETGKLYAIVGPSGCGKTTLLSLLGGLDSPESGRIDVYKRQLLTIVEEAETEGSIEAGQSELCLLYTSRCV